ncbi:unnamed protein product [Rhizoctonia solani]|uniref:CHAT domain-containing protein n=1 Tax=Rhizoctonia solani TaxID=456999 RepID=A0A8H3E2N9_9AGAM|nr:unnamed protein product [Rhizoctonia solani]
MAYQSRALASTPDGHPELPSRLGNLAVCYNERFERLGELNDLEQAIAYESRALESTPDGHPHLPIRLANLAVSYSERFGRLGEPEDLEQALAYGSRALESTPDGHPDLPRRLGNLAMSYRERFGRLGELRDLEQATKHGACVLATITSDHPDSCFWHFHHAMSYIAYYNYSHDPSHLHQALPLLRSASTLSAGSPRRRFQIAYQWALSACEHSVLNPIEAFRAAIDLLPQFIWLGTTADQRYHDLTSIQTLAVDAAHAAIVSSSHSLALEWLEHARCVAWNQNLMLRSPLDQLLGSHPVLATRLQKVASEFYEASSSSRESLAVSRSITLEQVAQDHRRLAQEYEDLLTQARIQPGFEDLLRPMKAAGLIYAARNGPIVVINCHEQGSDAIMILPNQSTVAHLSLSSFSVKKAQDAHSNMRSILRRKGIRERGFSLWKKPERQNDSEFGDALMMLWTDVVKPVLDFLGLTAHDPGARLPHITWCPTGAASFLPLHAAGDYSQPVGSRVFDYVVSSYTPTLTALLASQPSALNCNSKVLAIGQANTPGHNELPGTTAELQLVKTHVANCSQGPSEQPQGSTQVPWVTCARDLVPQTASDTAPSLQSPNAVQLDIVERPPARARDAGTMKVSDVKFGCSRTRAVYPCIALVRSPLLLLNTSPRIKLIGRERGLDLKTEPVPDGGPSEPRGEQTNRIRSPSLTRKGKGQLLREAIGPSDAGWPPVTSATRPAYTPHCPFAATTRRLALSSRPPHPRSQHLKHGIPIPRCWPGSRGEPKKLISRLGAFRRRRHDGHTNGPRQVYGIRETILPSINGSPDFTRAATVYPTTRKHLLSPFTPLQSSAHPSTSRERGPDWLKNYRWTRRNDEPEVQ